MTFFISLSKLRFVAVAVAAFLSGAIASPLLASSALAPVTLQPGQQITIVAANLPTPTTAPTVATTPAAAPAAAPTATPTPAVVADATPSAAVSSATTDPAAMPTSSLPGWNLIWADDFNTWNSTNYFAYPVGWHDTTGRGSYTPSIMSASGGNLNIAIQTVNGVHEVAAFCPLLPGSLSAAGHNRGDLLGMRYSFRIRADALSGYKGVPLLWPQSELWPQAGEVDGPESDFTTQPAAFIHHQNGTSSSDQDYYLSPSGTNWQAWHTYTVEWVPGTRVDMWIDGTQWVHDTTRIPSTARMSMLASSTSML